MKFKLQPTAAEPRRAAFTLVEVLAAIALMAVVIPVIVQALHTANLAGVVSQRKALAARIAERVLAENVVSRQWNQGVQNGTEMVGAYQFRWTLKNDPWNQKSSGPQVVNGSTIDASYIHQLAAEVSFTAQGQNYSVRLTTLVDTSQQ